MTKCPLQPPQKCSLFATDLTASILVSAQLKTQISVLESLETNDLIALEHDWMHSARNVQIAPDGDWIIWLFLGGRGAGKTRAGAEWIRAQIHNGAERVALVAPTYADAREVMIEGESGLRNIGYPSERPIYESSRRRLVWPNGAVGHVFSAEDPDGLRGPQFDAGWADEFCAWSYPEETLSNLRFGLRLGSYPRLVVTSTPKPMPALRKLIAGQDVTLTRAGTLTNKAHLSPVFMQTIFEVYGGTRLGRQELDGEILDDLQGALWTRQMIEQAVVEHAPCLDKTIVSIDPPVTSGARADSCGIIVAGSCDIGRRTLAYVLHDGTLQGLSPERWAKHAVAMWEKWDADYILVEINQGGEMVKSVFNAIDAHIPIRTVYASRGKVARAEPVAALYEQGKVKHVGNFPELEDELCALGTLSSKQGKSPDRADALVWAINDLLLKSRSDPRLRQL
ncbi:MAG: ATP-binding protein [Robiginitomaculum sp.]|nr:MAG: ATP-binding protein [Robiginitomaculum sp.]